MHIRDSFRIDEPERALAALREIGLITIVCAGVDGSLFASRAITLLRRDQHGLLRLWSHLDKRNPQLSVLADARKMLAIGYGPHAYVSPAWRLKQPSVPALNHVTVHVRGRPRFVPSSRPEVTEWLLREKVAEYEARRNTPFAYDPPLRFHSGLARGVVAFEIEIDEVVGAFKLGQDAHTDDRKSIIVGLRREPDSPAQEIARLMQAELDLPGSIFASFDPPVVEQPERSELGDHWDLAEAGRQGA